MRRLQEAGHRPIALAGGGHRNYRRPRGQADERALLPATCSTPTAAASRSAAATSGATSSWASTSTRRVRGEHAYGLTTPLVLTADGTKSGKTEAGNVALACELTALVHGEAKAARASRAAEVLFTEEIAGPDEGTLLEVFPEAVDHPAPPGAGGGWPLLGAGPGAGGLAPWPLITGESGTSAAPSPRPTWSSTGACCCARASGPPPGPCGVAR